MEKKENERIQFVYFLHLHKKLPYYYFHLSANLSEYHIKLIPITKDQLGDINKSKAKPIVISVQADLVASQEMKRELAGFLGFLLKSRRISLFHVSSFEKDPIWVSYEKTNNYFFQRLPENYDVICRKVCFFVAENLKMINSWPGGKRAKLPSM